MLRESLIIKDLVLDKHPEGWPLPFHLELGLNECLIIEGIGTHDGERLLEAASTLVPPLKGEVQLWGQAAASLTREEIFPLRRRIALITPRQVLLHRLTIAENLTLGPSYYEGTAAASLLEAARPLLERLELEEHLDAYPPQLPSSLAHRAVWAREFMKKPDLILALLGDPLDPQDKQRLILPLLNDRLRRHRTPTLLMGRGLKNFHPLAHRLLRLHEGRLQEHHFLEHESRPLVSFLPLF